MLRTILAHLRPRPDHLDRPVSVRGTVAREQADAAARRAVTADPMWRETF
jgi:hypothetical protein